MSSVDQQTQRLYESLVDSYDFQADRLVKKTTSMKNETSTLYLVSYYRAHDVQDRILDIPSMDVQLVWMLSRVETRSAIAHHDSGGTIDMFPSAETSLQHDHGLCH